MKQFLSFLQPSNIHYVLYLILVTLCLASCNFPITPLSEESKAKPFIIEMHAQQFKWTACYTGDDSIFGKRNWRMYSETNPIGKDTTDPNTADDFWVTEEFHIPKNREVQFYFYAKDVIHGAYFPQFNGASMNVVPGVVTTFRLSMAKPPDSLGVNIAGTADGETWLMCNKICGAGHYTMKMKMVIDNETNFRRWWDENENE